MVASVCKCACAIQQTKPLICLIKRFTTTNCVVYILCRYCYNSFCRSHFSLYSILNPDLHDAVRWRTALCHDKNEDVERWMRLRARPYARIRQSSCEERNKRVFLFFSSFFRLDSHFRPRLCFLFIVGETMLDLPNKRHVSAFTIFYRLR